MSDHINRLLTDFGNALGLEGLALDESGYCCLSFDEVVLNIESMGESSLALLYTRLGVLPEDASSEICRRLLAANHFFKDTALATIGLDEASRNVDMTRVLETAGMEVLDWEAAIKAFVDAAESCAKLLQASADSADASQPLALAERSYLIRG